MMTIICDGRVLDMTFASRFGSRMPHDPGFCEDAATCTVIPGLVSVRPYPTKRGAINQVISRES